MNGRDRILLSELGREIVARVLDQSVHGVRHSLRELAANGLPMLRAALRAERKGQNRPAVLISLRAWMRRHEKRPQKNRGCNQPF